MFGFGNMFPEIVRPFNVQYRSYPVHMLSGNERDELEKGGKIIMPTSALDQLARLNINYPMLFKLTNKQTDRITHCGVLEFVAEEGRVYLPQWMMNNLLLNMGDYLSVESANLPVATFSRFQPQSADFLDITNPKAVLENGLRLFACLTTGDIIAIKYNDHIYELCVLETQPGPAVTIIECDMNVEFAPPLGYKDPETVSKKKDEEMVIDPAELMPEPSGFVAFKGEGNRLDGKKKKGGSQAEEEATAQKLANYKRGIPDYDYKVGTLKFIRNARPTTSKENKENIDEFKAFCGEGNTLRSKKKWRGTD